MTDAVRTIRVSVYHRMYGCETGCCGHVVELTFPDGEKEEGAFHFEHPGGSADMKAYAREFAEREIKREWPKHLESIDWDTMEVEVQRD